jgi:hypothetical protein
MVADDSAIQTFLLQKSTLIDFVESDNMRCKCGCKWKLKRTLYEYTAGTFEFNCTNPACKNTTSFTTQRRGEQGDYTLNALLVGTSEVNCGSLTRLNCMLSSLRAATIPESFHTKISKRLNLTLIEQSNDELHRSLMELKAQAKRDLEVDGRFNIARDGKYCSLPAINHSNNKLVSCDTLDVKNETPSKNAWKAEDYAGGLLMDKLEAYQIELDNYIHDACRQMAKRLEEHKKTFRRLNDEGKLKEPYRGNSQDNNVTWHSNGSSIYGRRNVGI